MKTKKESFFWTSYSDLMTSLFFVMLILFIVTICVLHNRMVVTKGKLEAIEKIINSTKDLTSEDYFYYNEEYEKFVLNIKCTFPKNEAVIKDTKTKVELKKAGIAICDFLKKYENNSYLLIIEGQASSDTFKGNYVLSYNRAKALVEYWHSLPEIKNHFGKNCEVLIAGSGDNKIDLGKKPMRDKYNEANNQRFIIHIIPKNIINE